MKRNIIWVIVVIIAALVQTTWLDAIKYGGVLPDLMLLLVVYFAIADGQERAMFTGVLGGIYQDVASNTVLGHHVLCLAVVGYVVGRISTRLITEHPAVKAALVFFAAFVHGLLFTLILYIQKPQIPAMYTIATSVVPGAFYTGVVTPLIFFLLALMFHRQLMVQRGAV